MPNENSTNKNIGLQMGKEVDNKYERTIHATTMKETSVSLKKSRRKFQQKV